MFTGLIETVGVVVGDDAHAVWLQRVAFGHRWDRSFAQGESVAVNGVCLTVTTVTRQGGQRTSGPRPRA